MITLNQFKKLLGKDAADFDDKQIEKIRADMYTFADASIEKWLHRGKPMRAYIFDLSDPSYCQEFLWYSGGIRTTLPI